MGKDREANILADKPGRFVTFPGFEWSGNTPFGGDRNVYFKKEGAKIGRSSRELLPGQESKFPDAPTAKALFQNMKKQKVGKKDLLLQEETRAEVHVMHLWQKVLSGKQ